MLNRTMNQVKSNLATLAVVSKLMRNDNPDAVDFNWMSDDALIELALEKDDLTPEQLQELVTELAHRLNERLPIE